MSPLAARAARAWALGLVLLLQACAFPPSCIPLTEADFADAGFDADAGGCGGRLCAGKCVQGVCVAAFEGEPCFPGRAGPVCEPETSCQGGVCVRDGACTSEECLCAGLHCAGRCESGVCVAVELGDACQPDGAGPACLEGTCRDGLCQQGPGSVAPIALGDFLSTERSLYCDWLVRCDFWPRSLQELCAEAYFPLQPLFDSDAEAVAAAGRGETSYSPEEAGACLRPFAQLGCGAPFPAACDRIFRGQGTSGATCSTTAVCAPDRFCRRTDITGLGCAGACQPRAKAGEDCSEVPCVDGLVCVSEGGPGSALKRCRAKSAPGAEGSACGNGRDACQAGLYCRQSDHLCARQKRLNEACDDAFGCLAPNVCAVVDGGSRAKCLPRRQPGETCESNQQCAPLTLSVAAEFCKAGRCAALPREGACVQDDFLRHTCDPTTSFCSAEKQCRPLRATNEPCQDGSECGGVLSSNVCSFGACRAPAACPATP